MNWMNVVELLSYGKEVTDLGYILTVAYSLALYCIARFLLNACHKMIQKIIAKHGTFAETAYGFLYKVAKIVVYAIVLYLILMQFKALKSLGSVILGTSSLVGVALALAGQESMSNIVSGFFLSMYQPIRVNDLITLTDKNITGRVKEIGTRHTVLVTFNNTEVIVPNSVLNSSIIENKDINKRYFNFLIFSISYDSDMDKAISIIKEKVNAHPLLVDDRTEEQIATNAEIVKVLVINLAEHSIDLRAGFSTADMISGVMMSADLRKSVLEEFRKAGIKVPYSITEIIQK